MKYLNKKNVFIPLETTEEFNTYHTFVVQVNNRKKLINFLKSKNISTAIHYPIPIHNQKAYKRIYNLKPNLPKTIEQSKKILSLPINEHLTENEIKYISYNINKFYNL